MRTYHVTFAAVPGRNPQLHTVAAHDRVHAAYQAWRAAGRRMFPKVQWGDVLTFDGVIIIVINTGEDHGQA